MSSFPLAFIPLAVPKFLCLKLHLFLLLSQVHKSFCSFLNFEKFSTVKLPRKFQKNQNQSFLVKSNQGAPFADQGSTSRPGGQVARPSP